MADRMAAEPYFAERLQAIKATIVVQVLSAQYSMQAHIGVRNENFSTHNNDQLQ